MQVRFQLPCAVCGRPHLPHRERRRSASLFQQADDEQAIPTSVTPDWGLILEQAARTGSRNSPASAAANTMVAQATAAPNPYGARRNPAKSPSRPPWYLPR